MDIADLISADRVILGLSAPSKQRVLQELSKRAAADLNLDLGQVFDVIVAREKLGSTGVGMGTAVPHARLAGAKSPYGIFAHLARPIDYESIDGMHVDLVCFLLLPPGNDKQNLVLLADIAKRLRAPDLRTRLRSAQTRDELHRALVGWKPSDASGTQCSSA
jgi:PTS system nitrogen regulatory IIA component